MEEKISVIIPVYNVEKYLKKCIDSIINQTYYNLEIIIVDDGSPDNCPTIIDEYAKLDKRVKAIHKQNGGVSSARNLGLKYATGDYIIFIDSDDYLAINMIEKLYKAMINNNADMSVCQILRMQENSNGEMVFLNDIKEPYKEKIYSTNEMIKGILLDASIGNFVCNKLLKKELIEGITFPEGKVYEDVATTYKLVHKAKKIVCINDKLYYYLIGRIGATTSSFSEKKILDSMEAYSTQYTFLIQHYPEVKEYSSVGWAKMFASAMEKILMNGYEELWQSEEVRKKYEIFKSAVKNISTEVLHEFLEPYRLMSVILLDKDRETYKHMFNVILDIKSKK